MGVTCAVRFGRNIHPSNESFEPNGLGSNSAAFEADAGYADHSARLGLVLLTMVIVFVVRRLTLAPREQR
jgi:hypothetical protein